MATSKVAIFLFKIFFYIFIPKWRIGYDYTPKCIIMLDKLNKILISLEDAMDSEDWSLVQHAVNKLEEVYEKIEMEDQFGEYED